MPFFSSHLNFRCKFLHILKNNLPHLSFAQIQPIGSLRQLELDDIQTNSYPSMFENRALFFNLVMFLSSLLFYSLPALRSPNTLGKLGITDILHTCSYIGFLLFHSNP